MEGVKHFSVHYSYLYYWKDFIKSDIQCQHEIFKNILLQIGLEIATFSLSSFLEKKNKTFDIMYYELFFFQVVQPYSNTDMATA